MGFTIESGIPMLTVFLQGLLSFFSPCVLPLIPVYISYFAGGAKTTAPDGTIIYPRCKTLLHTLFFVLGVSVTFFILGFGFTALGQFFSDGRTWFARIGGIIMILFGMYQLGLFGKSKMIESEHRLPLNLNKLATSPISAFLMGFTFSFSWTPCIGPTLGSVLLMAGSSASAGRAFMLIGVYTLGFIVPFIAVGLFTGTLLNLFKKHSGIVRYTVKIGAALLIIMGIMTLTGFMNGITSYLSSAGTSTASSSSQSQSIAQSESASQPEAASSSTPEKKKADTVASVDFTLKDQNGVEHKLSDYKGKTVFLNFWATWCPPCRGEMPDIQKLYEENGENANDVIILGVAAPNLGNEGSEEDIKAFLDDNGYTYPVLMDVDHSTFSAYGVNSYPTTFLVNADGNIPGYVPGAVSYDIMESVVKQAQDSVE